MMGYVSRTIKRPRVQANHTCSIRLSQKRDGESVAGNRQNRMDVQITRPTNEINSPRDMRDEDQSQFTLAASLDPAG
jgi:hypothetical protein